MSTPTLPMVRTSNGDIERCNRVVNTMSTICPYILTNSFVSWYCHTHRHVRSGGAPVTPSIRIDRSSPVPLYFQVAQRLEQLIESGEMPPGHRLDNEIALADQLGLSRPTMRHAIQHLVDKGLLVRKRGVGTQVVHAPVRRRVELSSLFDDLDRAHRQPRTEILSFGVQPVPEDVAAALRLPAGTEAIAFQRLRYAQEEPLALMYNYVPVGVAELSAEAL